jgi:List-Bact-rpt repeat protein
MDVRGSRVVRSFQHSGRRARLDVGATLLALVVALTSQAAVAGQLQLTWVDNAGGQAAFNVQRRVSTDTGYIDLVQQPPGVTGYTDGTVTAGITYCYRVQAYDDAGSSPYSNEACGDTASGLAVTVSVGGTGQGTVTSNPTGISCGTDCVETYSSGTVVTVSATAVSGSTFGGWSGGGCTGTAPCTFTGNAPVTVGATFTAASPPTAQTQSVVSLTLINADTDAPIPGYDPLPNGATLNLATLPTRRLNIRANTSPSTVGSVRFGYDAIASYRVENVAPYALVGDNPGPDYNAWTPSLGTHSVTATPYTQASAGGTRGTAKTQSFTVVDQRR